MLEVLKKIYQPEFIEQEAKLIKEKGESS